MTDTTPVYQNADGSLKWGQVAFDILMSVKRKNGVYRIIRLNDLQIYVSPAGRTRVFRDGVELVVPGSRDECPVCGREVAINKNGELRIHGQRSDGSVCPGARPASPEAVAGADYGDPRTGPPESVDSEPVYRIGLRRPSPFST
jgi:hypothetical protein